MFHLEGQQPYCGLDPKSSSENKVTQMDVEKTISKQRSENAIDVPSDFAFFNLFQTL